MCFKHRNNWEVAENQLDVVQPSVTLPLYGYYSCANLLQHQTTLGLCGCFFRHPDSSDRGGDLGTGAIEFPAWYPVDELQKQDYTINQGCCALPSKRRDTVVDSMGVCANPAPFVWGCGEGCQSPAAPFPFLSRVFPLRR
eukprot:gene34491-49605_t